MDNQNNDTLEKRPSIANVYSELFKDISTVNKQRKRPFDTSLCEDDSSPSKVARLDNKENSAYKRDKAVIQKGRERIKEYKFWLEKKLKICNTDFHNQRQLIAKDNVISALESKILELENRTHDNASSPSTQKLLDEIRNLENENERLRKRISDLETYETLYKRGNIENPAVHSMGFTKFDGRLLPRVSGTEKDLKTFMQILSETEEKIKKLKTEKENLKDELNLFEIKKREQEKELRQKISHLENKLFDANMQCVQEQIKFTEHLADNPTMIVVESRAPKRMNLDDLYSIKDISSILSMDLRTVNKEFLLFSKSVMSSLKDFVYQVQEAIKTTDEKNKELVMKYTKEIQLRKSFHNQLVELRGNIRVFCRVRPCIKEDGETETMVTTDPYDDGVITINNRSKSVHFQMDKVFHMDISQSQVFEEVSSLVRSAIDGYNVCIFAYGQTGSGKTYTMEGSSSDPGVNQRALQFLYEETKNSSWQYNIEASMLEIYNETIRDLLNPDTPTDKLEVKMKPEGGLYVPGLVTVPVRSLAEINKIFETGRQNRSTAATSMNERSSRSHCLLCVSVVGVNLLTGSKTFGRLNLVDLAGSERVSKSHADGARLKEAQNINKSLSSLGDVISALKNKHSHIPYRNSKLTYLLQDSLGGDSKTLMILQVSPVEKNINESICTLNFGQRVMSAELGQATRKVEEGKNTPSSARRANSDTPNVVNSPIPLTPTNKTPNIPKCSTVPSKLNQRFK
ncbi:kinesin-like protein KIFC3 isoform X2 [Physella acuta]|uniref:kinesin-like protein KIFC3 isoform X2 n=1 Tax=Physella acuta TaxID=109671 RepID=UPI0027DBC724|nr:kinesin-like protein KIFC3 isoform X2 [Physella acuta]